MPGNRAETICILGKIVNSHFNAFNLGRIWIILNSFFIVIRLIIRIQMKLLEESLLLTKVYLVVFTIKMFMTNVSSQHWENALVEI